MPLLLLIPLPLRLLPGAGHTWNGTMRPVLTRLPASGTLYELSSWDDRSLAAPISAVGNGRGRSGQFSRRLAAEVHLRAVTDRKRVSERRNGRRHQWRLGSIFVF